MKRNADRWIPYLYSTPFLLLLSVFMVAPFLLNIAISFTNYRMTSKTYRVTGLKNYIDLLGDARVLDAIGRTFVFIAGILVLTMLLGMFYALVMSMPLRGIGVIKAIVLLPWIIPESVTAYVWKWLLSSDSGILYHWLLSAGLIAKGTSFFFDARLAMGLVIWVNAWRTAPFVAIMTYAKLKSLPASHVEAAHIDGAGAAQTFWHITLPWLSPILSRCVMLLFVWSFNSFAIIYIMTNGGPASATTTLPFLIRQTAFTNYHFGQATALAVISLLLILLCWGLVRTLRAGARRARERRRIV